MRYQLGRFLQLLGLVLLPAGIAGNLAQPDKVTLWVSLTIAGVGIALFYLGWLLARGQGGGA